LEVTPFDHTLKAEFINEYYNMTINFSKSREFMPTNQRPQTLEIEELEKVNEKVRELSDIAGENAPSFISNDKIAFMSNDNIIMCYQVFNVEDGKKQECFNVA
jgi:hypothetical protein